MSRLLQQFLALLFLSRAGARPGEDRGNAPATLGPVARARRQRVRGTAAGLWTRLRPGRRAVPSPRRLAGAA